MASPEERQYRAAHTATVEAIVGLVLANERRRRPRPLLEVAAAGARMAAARGLDVGTVGAGVAANLGLHPGVRVHALMLASRDGARTQ